MQVILWLERNDSRIQLSGRVERRDVNTLINSSENEAMFRQISRVVVKADLLRYEVSLLKYSEFPTIRLAENKDAIKFASVYVELSEDQQKKITFGNFSNYGGVSPCPNVLALFFPSKAPTIFYSKLTILVCSSKLPL